jgi:hypothetical protein
MFTSARGRSRRCAATSSVPQGVTVGMSGPDGPRDWLGGRTNVQGLGCRAD